MLGAIEQQMPPVQPGAPYKFGFNVGAFTNKIFIPEELAAAIEAEGLSYDTVSFYVSGWLNPYVTIEGFSVSYWESGSDLGFAIYNTLVAHGYPIQPGSIQFRAEPYYPEG